MIKRAFISFMCLFMLGAAASCDSSDPGPRTDNVCETPGPGPSPSPVPTGDAC